MTTNHVEQLDPALIRPGRVDFSALVDDASPVQARALFTQFYRGGADEELSVVELESLAQRLQDTVEEKMKNKRRVSMAALQGHFIRNKPREAVGTAPDLFST